MDNQVFEDRPTLLTDNLFSLTNPWRDRFLAFVAQRALGGEWDGQLPTKTEVTSWLGKGSLCQAVALLLNTWQGDTNATADAN
jgi:hypothetical protein